jgi:hypothetical protein
VAVCLCFYGTEGGYREVAAVNGMSKSWCYDIVTTISQVLASNAKD